MRALDRLEKEKEMRVSKFEKQRPGFGSPVYTCRICSKQTRETGDGESDCDLCWKCFEICGLENTISDCGAESPKAIKAAARIAEIKALK